MDELIDNIDFGDFRTFQVFQSKSDLLELTELLRQHDIPFQIEDYRLDFISAANADRFSHEFVLKLRVEDFVLVDQLIADQIDINFKEIPSDYYLLSYSNDDLMDILRKKDEWNPVDYVLAREILISRGIGISDEEIAAYQKARLEQLTEAKTAPDVLIVTGYVFAFLGGFLGLITGFYLANGKKVLPNGEQVYLYAADTRKHGRTMKWIAIIGLLFWLVIQWTTSISLSFDVSL